MLAVWTVAVTALLTGPIRYFEMPSEHTWAFIGGCLGIFALGSFAARAGSHPIFADEEGPVRTEPMDALVRTTALLGIAGALCLLTDKVFLSGLDYSQGITAVRLERADAVLSGTAGELRRSPLLYLGFATFAFSVPAYLLYLIAPERLRRSTVILAYLGLISPVAFSLVYGGRSPIGVVLLLILGAAIVRRLGGRAALPDDRFGRRALAAAVVLAVGYSSYIFTERRSFTSLESYDDLEEHFQAAYAARPSPVWRQLIDSGFSGDLVMNALMTYYYVTHELPMLDRTLRYKGSVGPYHGQYQFYLASAFLARVAPSMSAEPRMTDELREADLYGWFSGAWGGMYLDFGVVGGLLATGICGWVAGRVYDRALRRRDVRYELLMCYVVAGIMVSPVLSLFTISISLPVLAAILVSMAALPAAHAQRREARLSRLSNPS
jgi:hypothetical protein